MKRNFFRAVCLAAALVLCIATAAPAADIVMEGSTTVLPIAMEIAEAYMADNPGVSVSVSGGGSGYGIKAIIDQTADIGNASRFIKNKELDLAIQKGGYPVPHRVAYDCIIPVVHPRNPVSNLSLGQLQAIYQKKIYNWEQVGGEDESIVLVSRDTSSGTFEVWETLVMKKEKVHPSALLVASNGAMVQAVSKNPKAIGYIGIGYLSDQTRPLMIDGVPGNRETTLSGEYPVSRPLFMFTQGWPQGPVLDFINYVAHPAKGQIFVKKSGFIPLYEPPRRAPEAPRLAEEPMTASLDREAPPVPEKEAPKPAPAPMAKEVRTQAPAVKPGQPEPVKPVAAPAPPPSTEAVFFVQRHLAVFDYSPGPADGVPGRLTTNALKAYEKDMGMTPGGVIRPQVLERMKRQARALQSRLAEMGFNPGPVDGVVGPRTENAVRAFQKSRGWAPTGQVSRGLEASLGLSRPW